MANDDHELDTYRFCTECGTQAANRAKFCGECGHSLQKQDVPVPSQVPNTPPPVITEEATVEDPGQASAILVPLVDQGTDVSEPTTEVVPGREDAAQTSPPPSPIGLQPSFGPLEESTPEAEPLVKLKLDLHEISNRGGDIDRALRAIMDEAIEKKVRLVEIIPGKGSGKLKKRVLRFLDQKEIKALYDRVEKDSHNFGRIFVHFRPK